MLSKLAIVKNFMYALYLEVFVYSINYTSTFAYCPLKNTAAMTDLMIPKPHFVTQCYTP